jgi:DNA-binding PadR family transcriptional regulator
MTLQELSKQVYPDTEVEIKGKVYPYIPNLQRDGFVKGYEEALKNIYTVGQLKECWKDAQYEMHKSFSSSYVGITFEQWLNEKFKI